MKPSAERFKMGYGTFQPTRQASDAPVSLIAHHSSKQTIPSAAAPKQVTRPGTTKRQYVGHYQSDKITRDQIIATMIDAIELGQDTEEMVDNAFRTNELLAFINARCNNSRDMLLNIILVVFDTSADTKREVKTILQSNGLGDLPDIDNRVSNAVNEIKSAINTNQQWISRRLARH